VKQSGEKSENQVRTQLDVHTEYQLTHRLFGAATKRLPLLWASQKASLTRKSC
jgi:hypothetical protein